MPLGAHRLNSLALPSIAEEPVITSRIPLTISAFDNAQVSTAQSKFGGASLYLDGATDYIQAEFSETLGVGTGDFTFELWYYTSNNNQNGILYNNRISAGTTPPGNGNYLRILNGNLEWSPDPTTIVYSVTAPAVNTWHHVAVTRESGDLNVWVDGTSVINITSTHDFSGSRPLSIGEFENGVGAADFIGYVDEFRASNIARYSSSFTPPTEPFTNDSNTLLLIHMDGTDGSTYFEDDTGIRSPLGVSAIGNAQVDTAQSEFGGASLLLDGTGDYLQTQETTEMTFGTGDFTMEAWIRLTNLTNEAILSGRKITSTSFSESANVLRVAGGKLTWSNGQAFIETGVLISLNTWHHVAVSRESGTLRLFVDGAVGLTSTQTVDIAGNILHVGCLIPGVQECNGNIDEIRVSNVARYTGAFTPSTTPFVNDADTVILVHCDGTDGSTDFVDDNGIRSPLGVSAIGNAQIDTAQSQFGGASVLFDGTGDYLNVYPDGRLAHGTNDFTIEYFFRYSGGLPDKNRMTWEQRPGSNGAYPLIYHTTTGAVVYFVDSSARITSSSLSANVWYHLAIVRSGSTTTMYIDGTSAGTWSDSTTYLEGSPRIGDNMLANAGHSGHMDELRVSNVARYTANFTTPTEQFTNDENTLLLLHFNGADGSTVFVDDN